MAGACQKRQLSKCSGVSSRRKEAVATGSGGRTLTQPRSAAAATRKGILASAFLL